jgi:Domain of unknown function (DUF4279)
MDVHDENPLGENANCEYTHVAFRLGGDRLRPEVIERRTGLVGDFGAEKGRIRPSRREGRPAIKQRTGVWYTTTENRIASTSLERHVLFLLERVEPVAGELRALMEEQGLRADFHCYWVSATGQGGPIVTAETLSRMGAIGATLGFEFHGPWPGEGLFD